MCRLCRYLFQPSAKPSIAKVKREARGRKGKRGEARESDAAELRRTQPKGDRREKKGKSEEGRGKNQIANKLID